MMWGSHVLGDSNTDPISPPDDADPGALDLWDRQCSPAGAPGLQKMISELIREGLLTWHDILTCPILKTMIYSAEVAHNEPDRLGYWERVCEEWCAMAFDKATGVAIGPLERLRQVRDEHFRACKQRRESRGDALAGLPSELIERILHHLDAPRDLAAANAASRPFRGTPGGRSPVEHVLRARARARGHERALPAELPAGVRTWSVELLQLERVYRLACAHASPIACGVRFSAFVDAEGGLHTCGEQEEGEEEMPESDDEDEEVVEEVVPRYVAPLAIAHGRQAPPVYVPTRVASLSAVRVAAVAAGDDHLLALSEAGAVYGCGNNHRGQLGLGHTEEQRSFTLVGLPASEPVVCIAAGCVHSLALTAAGCAYSWGKNFCGELGHGDTEQRREPTRIETLGGVRVGGVSAGGFHTLLLSTTGCVFSCGLGNDGQLGHGNRQDQHTPRRIEALAGVRAVHVSAGGDHSLVVDADGGVRSFGVEAKGTPRRGDWPAGAVPKRIEALAGVRAVRAYSGHFSSAVLGADGSVHTFGGKFPAMLGTERTDEGHLAPSRVTALSHTRVVRCAMGQCHSLFETAGGDVYACGEHSGALGLGLGTAVDGEPMRVATPALVGSLRTAFR